MFDYIMTCVFTGIFLVMSLVAFIFLLACLYPRWILKPDYRIHRIKDRGIKRYTFPNGRAITYQPALNVRPYIKSYILSCVDGKKNFKCELAPTIVSMRYELLVYDASDKVITVLQVSDDGIRENESKSVLLPAETAYVSLILRRVNGKTVSKEPIAAYSRTRIAAYYLAIIATVVAEMYFIRYGILFYFETGMETTQSGTLFMFVTSALGGALYALITFGLHRSKNTRVSKK